MIDRRVSGIVSLARCRQCGIEIVGEITEVEVIAQGRSLRERKRIAGKFGRGRWRKLKGFATVALGDGTTCQAEIHWYEAHGIGRRNFKIKRFVD